MDTADAASIIILIILMGLSAFFSGSETALVSCNRIRIRTLAEDGDKRAITLLGVLDQQSKMLSAILILNNIVNLSASALTTVLTIHIWGNRFVGLGTGILTLLLLVFGEISPKTYAAVHAEDMALKVAGLIRWLMLVMTPLIVVINALSGVLLRLTGTDPNQKGETITEDELRTIVDVSHEEGVIENEERKMINNVVDFGDTLAKDVMIPRINMDMIDVTSTHEEVMEIFRRNMYTRFPVYEESVDNVIGILNLKDLILLEPEEAFDLRRYLREAFFTYEFKRTSELFIEMRQKLTSMAVVLDEYGAVVGLVTMEDLLEEIVGEIRDEFDAEELKNVQKLDERSYRVDGSMKLDDLDDMLSLEIESEEYDSLGGFVIGLLDHLPSEGETVEWKGIRFTVEAVDKNHIEWIRMDLPEEMKEVELPEEMREADSTGDPVSP